LGNLPPEMNRISAVQSDASIKRQALRIECNGPVAYSDLQSRVLQRTFQEKSSPGASTLENI
jgi:hypothetical protein